MPTRWYTRPAFLAAVVCLLNAVKPAVVDDTAYLLYARQVAADPLDPYGFEVFWYTVPEPAMEVLCPPVVPYWLGVGMTLVGESVPLLKLWLFPFVWLLGWALRELLRRLARGTEGAALPLLMLSPAALPTVNLMLDIPAAALGLAGLAVFARACDRRSWRLAAGAGLLGGLAMQTKYSTLLMPAVIFWYGLTHRQARAAGLAVVVAAGVFAGWELLLVQKYGRSHFLTHLAGQEGGGGLAGFVREKFALLPGLVGHLGLLAVGVGLYAGRAGGWPWWAVRTAAVVWAVCVAFVCFVPAERAVMRDDKRGPHTPFASPLFKATGSAVLLTAAGGAGGLLVRRRQPLTVRRSADSWFVAGWVAVEVAGYFALTPFPAARRVIGLTLALGVLAARLVRLRPDRRPGRWVVPFGVTVGLLTAAVDTLDAYPEKALAERAAAAAADRPAGARVWYMGHWGFQWYCERAGMVPVVPGQSVLRPGDVLVLPLYPAGAAFPRPHAGAGAAWPPTGVVEPLAEFVWGDPLSAQTVPNLYGGDLPLVGRDHPRLRVGVYRLTRGWEPGWH